MCGTTRHARKRGCKPARKRVRKAVLVLSSATMSSDTTPAPERSDFIRDIIAADLREGRRQAVVTRFPPEPNGYLHIGHAKSICLNFGVAAEFGGRCHLRFDDTNPMKEEQEYIDSIEADVRWLGFDWGDNLFFASDYFEQLYDWAVHLIKAGKAYVDDLSAEEIREHRGTLTEPGKPSPWRDRAPEESLELFERMRAGQFPNGARVLRARIDMAAGNINMRDPVLYRIVHAEHPRTGDAWCIYPTYDFAHGQSDAIEGITHSICTLEFQDHRPLYDWFIQNLPVPSEPHQYEFARLNLTHTVLSKRVLIRLVKEGQVCGWDDPRMPTISGVRRRGFPAEGIRNFAQMIGVARADSIVEFELFEHAIREVLNKCALRRFAVLDPIRVVIDNYPEGQVERMEVANNPEDPEAGARLVEFSRELYIERDDFMEEPPAKFFRLAPGREVRLRSAYFITCNEVVKDEAGNVVELRCSYDPATRGGAAPDGRKVKGTLHWLSASHATPAEVRLYDHLFASASPGSDGRDLFEDINPNSEKILTGCFVEPSLVQAPIGETVQFERLGYFCPDPDSADGTLVFNRTLTLKDTWAKLQAQGKHV
jgi:glutaminyl-tRNA synthetase